MIRSKVRIQHLLTSSMMLLFFFVVTPMFSQVDFFNVTGEWAGNDANGNAIIKWEIEICTGQDSTTNLVIAVPEMEMGQDDSGGVGLADEDSPADDQVCNGYWTSGWNTFRPTNYRATGILAVVPEMPRNSCRSYIWTTYSKDYDSSADDYDHYVVAHWYDDNNPNPGFVCPTDGHIDCNSQNTNIGSAQCVDQIDCDDVATNNYEQIAGLAYDLTDGPNFRPDCEDGAAFDMTWSYVVCHHGQSDYLDGCDKTSPGQNNAVDILPDSITNVVVTSNLIQVLQAQGAVVTNLVVSNPGMNQYLDINPAWTGTGVNQLTLPSSTIPPGVEEDLSLGAACVDAMPECDTIEIYIEWMPTDFQSMYNSHSDTNCDDTGNISGGGANVGSVRRYWHAPVLQSYEPLNGYQDPNTAGVGAEGPPAEEATAGLDPDPEFGNCGATPFSTCSAGPGEDCSSMPVEMAYTADIGVTKNTTMVVPNFADPDYFDVTYCLNVTNEGDVNLVDPILTDDLVMTFGSSAGYILPFVSPPALNAAVVPAPNQPGGGFPMVNGAYDGNGMIQVLNGNGGIIEPGESLEICFTVTVDRGVLGDDVYDNQVTVMSDDCQGVWCVSDIDNSEVMLFDVDVALIKTINSGTPPPYTIGQTVTFDIDVINQGSADLYEVEVIDYLPCGYTIAPSSIGPWQMSGTNAVTTIPFIAGGTTETVMISVILQACSDPDAYLNTAEVSYMEDEFGRDVSMSDVDSMADDNEGNDPGGGIDTNEDNHVNDDGIDGNGDGITDEDDADPEQLPIFDLALEKNILTPPFHVVGMDIDFEFTVYNQGNQAVTNIDITDYLTAGYSFDMMANPGWDLVGGNLVYEYDGPLAPGASDNIPLTLTLVDTGNPDDWYNEGEISAFEDEDMMPALDFDSMTDSNPNNDNDVQFGDADDNVVNENPFDGGDEDDNDPAEPNVIGHTKSLVGVEQNLDGTFCATYNIVVQNTSDFSGTYFLNDIPGFDDDFVIESATYSSSVHPVTPLSTTPPAGGWVLANNTNLPANTNHVYTLEVCVSIDLESAATPGDGTYTACGDNGGGAPTAGEGLYNMSALDVNGDGIPEETDDVCADIPLYSLDKEIFSLTQTGAKTWEIIYEIEVCNTGGAPGIYDLDDVPGFENDIEVLSAFYETDAAGNPGNPGPDPLPVSGPWGLANNQSIVDGSCHTYAITVEVELDLTEATLGGDGTYTACGSFNPLNPTSGEGLYNEAQLDTDNDGDPNLEDEVCIDLPHISHDKTLTSITQTGARTWDVKYTITVENNGGDTGTYGLVDTPLFDTDINITGATYTSTAVGNGANPGPSSLTGVGPWTLASAQDVAPGTIDTYCLIVSVEMDLDDPLTPGDGIYTACGDGSGAGDPDPREGLYNASDLDTDNDGVSDEQEEACGDLPNINHTKDIVSVEIQADGSYDVTYSIEVTNCGGIVGTYGLVDVPSFDNDIIINGAEYTTNANPNAGNPGPSTLVGTGPWTLATGQSLNGGCATHTYTLVVNVSMDLDDPLTPGDGLYTACGDAAGAGDSSPGEGLHNESQLDVDGDGVADELDEACGELPHLTLDKEIASLTQTGPRSWEVVYTIEVCNDGGANGEYNLDDVPGFDDDIVIDAASFTTDAAGNPANPGPSTLATSGTWSLASDQDILPGTCQVYTITVDVTYDDTDVSTPGDESYTACGSGAGAGNPSPGEGLYNEAQLDVNDDGVADEVDEVCADLPHITHEKEITSITQTSARTWDVKYTITVENSGGATGTYGLVDTPLFDNDIAILGTTYTSTAASNAGNPGPSTLAGVGPWSLATGQAIAAGTTDTYCIIVSVEMDLLDPSTPGDALYSACGDAAGAGDSSPGEGLHNESDLDLDGDGVADEEDEACGDLPNINHVKDIVSVEIQSDGSYDVTYSITVTNCGGIAGTYGLVDVPTFDSDIIINSAEYSTSANPNAGNPGPSALAGTGPWTLATGQSLNGGCATHTYTLVVNVSMDLDDPLTPGDGLYTACGDAAGAGDSSPGEGLHNESQLDVDGDGVADELDEACGDLPHLTLDKEIASLTQTGPRSWEVVYTIEVCNDGGANGEYNLDDVPGFDDDIVIDAASFTTDAAGNPANPGPSTLATSGTWSLASDQDILPGTCQVYAITVDVTYDDTDVSTPGDESYTACGSGAGAGNPSPGEGLYNEAQLDVNDDGIADEVDEVCADLPHITHEKELTSITQTGARTWDVKYTITVENSGGATGTYGLVDTPLFDNDIAILGATYTSTAASNAGNPGPSTLAGVGPWSLATGQAIAAGTTDTYCIIVSVEMDILDPSTPGDALYSACGDAAGAGDSSPGEGLHNESDLDLDGDGVADEEDEACGDLPNINHVKDIVSVEIQPDGTYDVTYNIVVTNCGGIVGTYGLVDVPTYDNDVIINSAEYSTNANPNSGNPGPSILAGTGPWTLATAQSLNGGCASHTYVLVVNVSMDLNDPSTPGDGLYTACGDAAGAEDSSPGEGLHNESQLDVDGDGVADELDEACGDLPHLTLDKEIASLTQTGPRSWEVVYTIEVCNDGGANGEYNLDDVPGFDDDIVIDAASFTTDAAGNPANPGPSTLATAGTWSLASDQNILPGTCELYTITVDVTYDDTTVGSPGDDSYTACGSGAGASNPSPGEGLYNQAQLDVNDDGVADEVDEVCADLPHITHAKELTSITQTGARTWDVKYTITVENSGGAAGTYGLVDTPIFDNDIAILGATYTSTAAGNGGNPGPSVLAGVGPWSLATGQSIASGTTDTYCIIVSVEMDLIDPSTPGDGIYSACGDATGTGDSSPGEGLHNESDLDLDGDGVADEEDEACGDLPNINHVKDIVSVEIQSDGTYDVTYSITVTNCGGVAGDYGLVDVPNFDNDIIINSAEYTTNANPNAGNPGPSVLAGTGPWTLATAQSLNGGCATHTYTLVVNVSMDLNDPTTPGDGLYTACGDAAGAGDSSPGEGLHNESQLDVDGDGQADELDEACGDLPHLTLDKMIGNITQIGPKSYTVEYSIEVCNDGGADGQYDLVDVPGFDDDVVIDLAQFSSDAPGNLSNPGPVNLPTSGSWNFANDQVIVPGACHNYSILVNVTLDLTDPMTPGDENYVECGSATGGLDPSAGEGLYNEAQMDVNNDGIADEIDEVCGDIPHITHNKEITSITQTGARTWDVKYTITVENDGGALGQYDLTDETFYEDDITTLAVNYSSDAPGNPANPGPVNLPISGLWILGDDMSIGAGDLHTYCMVISVEMDLMNPLTPGDSNYDACGSNGLNDPQPGEGIYNESYLDLNNDGTIDEVDEACGDLPNVWHEKNIISFTPRADGDHEVVYEICVNNSGGADGQYTLTDTPGFDDDITIISASYTSTVVAGSTLTLPVPVGGWILDQDQTIAPGLQYCYTLNFIVDIDVSAGSSGDQVLTSCGTAVPGDPSPGEALYNESAIDINDDGTPDEFDEACDDIPLISHEKTIASITQNPDDSYCIVYNVVVTNDSEVEGFYDLYDLPQFENDFVILSAEYSSTVHILTTLPTTPPAGGWQIGDDEGITGNGTHIYELTICVIMDLQDPATPGDMDYTACGETGGPGTLTPGEGLYNESILDINDDGVADQLDTVCTDIPYITHTKEFVDAFENPDGTYTANFKITVENIGGAPGQYDLWDQPQFDDDFVINSSEYTTDAIGNPGNPGPASLPGTGPWTLADDQAIGVAEVQCFFLTVNVTINLSDPDTEGDEIYTWCGTANGSSDPEPGEGFYNESFLDRSNDGNPEEVEETCGDIEIVDMALIKTLVTPPQYTYGQIVEFELEVFNQGNIPMFNIVVNDYLPAGFGFAGVAGNDPLWSEVSPGLVQYNTLAGPIAAHSSMTLTLYLEVLPTTGGNSDWWNYAEINSMQDEDGNDVTDQDVDSTPNDDPSDDNQVEPDSPDDDDITGGGPDAGEDEDDHDVAGLEIFDLAQFKTTSSTPPYAYGDVIPFTITIYNQGSETATNIEVLDHIPCGFGYLTSNDANNWIYDSVTGIAATTIAGPLEPGDNTTVTIELTLQQCIDMDEESFTNYAEISGGDGEDGNPGDDIDSDPDDDPNNDGDPIDDVVDDPNDEDDHDPEEIPVYDLAQIKQLVTPPSYAYGDLLEFSITVCNQGNQTVQNIEITDYTPAGYSFDAADNPLPWLPVGTDHVYTIPGPLLEDECISIPLFLTIEQTTGGEEDWINYSEISDFEDENGDPQVDADSDPDNHNTNDGDPIDDAMDDPNDEDDHDPAGIEIFDLAQIKTTTATNPLTYGDVVPFTIEVFNQGSIAAYNTEVIDHIPCGFAYDASNDANGWVYDAALSTATINIAGPIAPGASMIVTIDLVLQQCIDMDESSFTNISEIASSEDEAGDPQDDIDSDPDNDPDNDGDPIDNEVNDPNDEDDHDPEEVMIWDLAQIKQLETPAPYNYGDLLEFKITVCNQGNQTVQNIGIIDYLPAGYSFDVADQSIAWIANGTDVEFTITGPLAEDSCIELPLFLTLEMAGGDLDAWTNISEISSFEDEDGDPQVDADSDPDTDPDNDGDPINDEMDDPNDEDDHDPETVEIFDLALIKQELTGGPFAYGDQVEYVLTVTNQGNVPTSGFTLTDYMPCGLAFDAVASAGWTYDAASSTASYIYSGTILPGATDQVSIFATIQFCGDAGSYYNLAEISEALDEDGDVAEDIDSDPDTDPDNDGDPINDAINDPNDEDDHDPEIIPIFDLALRKTIDDIGPYLPGEVAIFDIEIINQGNVDAYDIEITDYLNDGYIFDAAINPGWTQNGNLLSFTYEGPLPVGASDIVSIGLEVAVPAMASLDSWINEAEISEAYDEDGDLQEDADSTADDDPDNDNDVIPGGDNDDVVDENINDPFNEGDDDEDDNDVANILVTGEIGDTVWKDQDGDGVQDAGELGVEGVTVNLYDCDGNLLETTVTDATGYYLFDFLLPGNYQVEFDISSLPVGCDFTVPNQGDDATDSDADLNGLTECIELEAGEMNHTVDAGLLPLAKIGDKVWNDCDGNGIQNASEEGVAGIKVNLFDGDGNLVSFAYTDASGNYLFDNIYPGEYYVQFEIDDDYGFTFVNVGSDDSIDSDVNGSNGPGTTSITTLSPGECDINAGDAGIAECVQIGDLVWFDTNENNVWDSNENGVNGLKINLFRLMPSGNYDLWDYTYSGHKPGTPSDDGYFKFCAPPGTYYIEFAQPPYGMVPAIANQGNFEEIDSDVTHENGIGTTDSFAVTCDVENCDIGAGFYPMGTIGDFVWLDDNQNGLRDAGESGVQNVLVEAFDQNGVMLGSDDTDPAGNYYIDYLQATDVYLRFSLPGGYGITNPNMGTEDIDSDIDHSNGPLTTKYYSIVPGEHTPNVDAGLIFGVVPIELLSFEGENQGDHNNLIWEVTSQINASHYELERSYDNVDNFSPIYKVDATGETYDVVSYDFDDYQIDRAGTYYYRVKQIDENGEYDYTHVVAIKINSKDRVESKVSVYPNPMIDEFTLELKLGEDISNAEYEIFDVDGKLVTKATGLSDHLTEGKHKFLVDVRGLTPGIYTFSVSLENQEIRKKLIVVNN